MSNEIATAAVASAITTDPAAGAAIIEQNQVVTDPAAGAATITTTTDNVDYDVSKKLAMIAKREKAMMDKEKQLKEELERDRSSYQNEKSSYQKDREIAEAIKNKQWSKVKELIDYNDLTQFMLNDGHETPQSMIEKTKRELEAKMEEKIKAKDEEYKKIDLDRAQQAQKAAEQNFKFQIKQELSTDFNSAEGKFELLSLQDNPEELVYETMLEYYQATGKDGQTPKKLSTMEAAELVEKHLDKQMEKFLKLRKIKSKFEPKQTEDKDLLKKLAEAYQTKAKPPETLTNSLNVPSEVRTTNKMSWVDLEKSKDNIAKMIKWS